ncbi:MAG: M20/M25/M40 family metallo-hydrolase, partial [Chitinophagaceae bacterium]|nr:M20/M25/M40 family metallo-hydrolase [Chitinophagaceae bacterium]
MRIKHIPASLMLACLTLSIAGATANDSLVLKRIADEVLRNRYAYENLRFLCKKVGPRLSGSPGAEKSVTETARMMREAGADSVWLQPCMVPRWVRGEKETATLQYFNNRTRPLNVVALGNSVGTAGDGVRAEVVEVRSFRELDSLANLGLVKGKIVFYNYPMDPTLVQTFRAYGQAGAYRGGGPSLAAKHGAVGVLIRSLASNLDDYPHTGATRYNDSFPKLAALALSTNDAEFLSQALRNKQVKNVYMKSNAKMMGDVPSHNVIGEIRGTEFPDEVITVGGHLDSWDLGEGAHDDGAGCVQSIEVIRVMKALGLKPKRTIRAVMFMNEENGLRGGQAYAEAAKKETNKKFIFALESDAGGFVPRGFGFSGKPDQVSRLLSWKKLFEPYGTGDLHEGGGGADIGPLRPLGTVLSGLNPDSQRYFDVHHASSDVFEAVSPRELNLGAAVMAGMV